ncbi:NAD-dependent epimerase/dehydratase family protein [Ancylobacter vacuolatus]|uniref:UDP-glucose 4-epimerase n=1 Tax=Ancylobacter vacuolatus TaxID=223389 RepID=A0ABU0DKN6_9HYPH|nr:NAD-dependent epimerase/dehydratase family protein [Ancylobacter vacuolatus]MDQ0348997.1 UDP-glucose 4-epimerase [Ancylobacter vacuolatus]
MRVLVTGAGGFVGRHLVARLTEKGNDVVPVPREWFGGPPRPGSAVPAHGVATSLWRGCDAVVHLAGLIPRGGALDEADVLRVNVEGTRRIAQAAVDLAIPRIVFVSTASVHGSGGVTPLVETDPIAPANLYARSKALAETAFWEALGPARASGVVLRPTPIFGDGGHGPVALLTKLARLPVPLPFASVGGHRSIISIDSVVDILELCLTGPHSGTFLIANDEPLRAGDIIAATRQGLGRSPMLFDLPEALLAGAARLAGRAGQWEAMTQPFLVNTDRIKRETGWQAGPTSRQRLRAMSAAGGS